MPGINWIITKRIQFAQNLPNLYLQSVIHCKNRMQLLATTVMPTHTASGRFKVHHKLKVCPHTLQFLANWLSLLELLLNTGWSPSAENLWEWPQQVFTDQMGFLLPTSTVKTLKETHSTEFNQRDHPPWASSLLHHQCYISSPSSLLNMQTLELALILWFQAVNGQNVH